MHMFGVRAAAHGSRTRVSSHPSGSAARLSPERRLAARAQRGQQCADRRPNSAKRGRRVAHAISPSRAHLSPTRDGRLVALPALVERLVHLHQQAVEEGLAPQLPRVDGASEGREDAAQLKRHVEGEVAEGEPADAPRRRDEAAREQRRRLACTPRRRTHTRSALPLARSGSGQHDRPTGTRAGREKGLAACSGGRGVRASGMRQSPSEGGGPSAATSTASTPTARMQRAEAQCKIGARALPHSSRCSAAAPRTSKVVHTLAPHGWPGSPAVQTSSWIACIALASRSRSPRTRRATGAAHDGG
mmetsp:Transcript_59691/g.163645  ORF Transcript_59691/g.163645 Transcript_59691/m.163645 type:complete len:303 (+) Transcript_59691:154-1062(+)